jgi:hypothetical protein
MTKWNVFWLNPMCDCSPVTWEPEYQLQALILCVKMLTILQKTESETAQTDELSQYKFSQGLFCLSEVDLNISH